MVKVPRVDRFVGGVSHGGSLPRPAVHDNAMHMLDRPAVLHELTGQPVQKGPVGGRIPRLPKVIGSSHDPPPKVTMPEAVGHHARGKRVILPRYPLGKGMAPPHRVRGGRHLGGFPAENLGKVRFHLVGRTASVSPDEKMGFHGLTATLRYHQGISRSRLANGVPSRLVVGLDVAEEGQQLVVVALRDGIEHVIVTTRTSHRETEKCLRGGLQDIILPVKLRRPLVVRFVIPHPQSVESGRNPSFVSSIGQLVTRNLLQHKTVVWLVPIEGCNHIVAIAPGVRLLVIAFVTVTLRETHHIQPVPSPAFTIFRHGQQAIHQFQEGLRIRIINEGLYLCKARGKTEQGVVGAPDEDLPRSRGIGNEFLLLKRCLDDLVEVLLLPSPHRLERPVAAVLFADFKILPWLIPACSHHLSPRPGRPHRNPAGQVLDLALAKFLLWRHLKIRTEILHRLDEKRLAGLARHDGRSALTSLEKKCPRIETQPRLLLLRPVTLKAVFREERTDLLLEETQVLSLVRGKAPGQGSEGQTRLTYHPGTCSIATPQTGYDIAHKCRPSQSPIHRTTLPIVIYSPLGDEGRHQVSPWNPSTSLTSVP